MAVGQQTLQGLSALLVVDVLEKDGLVYRFPFFTSSSSSIYTRNIREKSTKNLKYGKKIMDWNCRWKISSKNKVGSGPVEIVVPQVGRRGGGGGGGGGGGRRGRRGGVVIPLRIGLFF